MRHAIGALLGLSLAACASPPRLARAPAPHEQALTVATYNVNFGLASDPATLSAVGATGADIVLLQETTPGWELAIRASLAAEYPHMAFHHSGGAGGLGVLSRHPIEVDVLPATRGWFPALRVRVQSPLGPVQCLSVHLRPPLSESGSVVSGYLTTPSVRTAEMQAFAADLGPDIPTVVAGDFNEGSGGALDHLESLRFVDAVPEFHATAPTWRWSTSVGEITASLDHVLYRDLVPIDARVVQAGRSDHLPVVVTFVRPR